MIYKRLQVKQPTTSHKRCQLKINEQDPSELLEAIATRLLASNKIKGEFNVSIQEGNWKFKSGETT